MTGVVFLVTPYYLEADKEQISRMKASSYRGKGGAAQLPVMLALWMSTLSLLIAVALLSALAPLGPPLSRATGSAFNPATSDVVLKARALATPQAVQAHRPGGDGPPATALLLPALALLLAGRWRMVPSGVATPFRALRPPRPRRADIQPRAPPRHF